MISPKDYETLWKQGLYQHQSTALALGISAERLKLYQGFVFNHQAEVLQKMYPRWAQVETVDWNYWIEKYYAAYPPLAWELNTLAKDFPLFMQGQDVPAYIPELLAYEWSEFDVYRRKVEMKGSGLRLNPAHAVHVFQYNIPAWVKSCEERQEWTSQPNLEPTVLVVARHPQNWHCVFTRLGLAEALIYEELEKKIISKNDLKKQILSQGILLEDFEKAYAGLLKQYILMEE
jgi:hypothetical protein